jgi:elongation factor 1-alpha
MRRSSYNLAFMGGPLTGKSTTAGHLIFERMDIRTKEKLERQAAEGDRQSSKYAWLIERLRSERERGIGTSSFPPDFETKKFSVYVIAPDRTFIRDMICGAKMANAVLLIVSAVTGEFEADLNRGHTVEHTLLAFVLGIKQVIVGVNKMDDLSVSWAEERYQEIKSEVSAILSRVGYTDEVHFVPISATLGDNLFERSQNTPWYKGPIIEEAVDDYRLPRDLKAMPLRLPIEHVYEISGVGTVAVGRVEYGTMRAGMTVMFAPSNHISEVRSIEQDHKGLAEALPGDNIGFHVPDVLRSQIHRGMVVCDPGNQPALETEKFIAQIVVLNHPSPISEGYSPTIQLHTARVACRFNSFIFKVDCRTGLVIQESPESIKHVEAAVVELVPLKPLCVETFAEFPGLGRFVIREMGLTVAVGIIKSVVRREPR